MSQGRTKLWKVIRTTALGVGGIGVFVGIQGARFASRVRQEVRRLWEMKGAGPRRGHPPESLPDPVRRYLEVAGATRRQPVGMVRLRHGGVFRPALDGPWRPIRGEQYFTADPPGFVWWGRVRLAPGVWIEGLDRSLAGEGSLRIVLASTHTLAESRGPEIDQGALQRLLGEGTWYPTSFLDERYVHWEAIDGSSARARLRVSSRDVEVTFHFGPDGLPSRVTADRYRDVNGSGVLTPWVGRPGNYREVDGLLVPFLMDGSWQVDGEWQPYVRFAVERIEFDRPEPF